VVVVASRAPIRVEPGGWEEVGQAVGGEPDGPFGVVDDAVVVAAEQNRVVQAGRSAVGPVDDVVESARGAVAALLPLRFPGPLSEPGVRLSPHRALHEVMPAGRWFVGAMGVGLCCLAAGIG
jgi:hypothetical protein